MSADRFQPEQVVTNSRGRQGVVWSVFGPLVKVVWDSDDEFVYTYRQDSEWLQPATEKESDR